MNVTLGILKQIIGDLYIENVVLRDRLETLILELQQAKLQQTEETTEE